MEVSGFLVNYLHNNMTEYKVEVGRVENSTKMRIGFKKTVSLYSPTCVQYGP